jgi:hypothetical protein
MKPEDKAIVKQALEAMELNNQEWKELADSGDCGYWKAEDQDHYKQTSEAITALRQLLERPTTEDSSDVDHGDELTIAYLDGVHTGKKMAKREWVDLEEIDFVGINQSCTTKMQAAAAAARLLKEKNT